MKIRACALLALSGLLRGQGGPPPVNNEAAVTPVPFDRILHASQQEPQNWLTYSGGFSSQRHSDLTQITPENARISRSNGYSDRDRSKSMKSRRWLSTALCIRFRESTM